MKQRFRSHCVTTMEEARELCPIKGKALDNWAKAQGFEAKPGQVLVLPDGEGAIVAVLVGCEADSAGLADPGFALVRLPGNCRRAPTGSKRPSPTRTHGADGVLARHLQLHDLQTGQTRRGASCHL
jgi:hypothetical protein